MKDRCGCVFASFSSRSVWIAFRRKTDRRQQMYPHFNFRNHCQTFSYENSFHAIFVARSIFPNFFFRHRNLFSKARPAPKRWCYPLKVEPSKVRRLKRREIISITKGTQLISELVEFEKSQLSSFQWVILCACVCVRERRVFRVFFACAFMLSYFGEIALWKIPFDRCIRENGWHKHERKINIRPAANKRPQITHY